MEFPRQEYWSGLPFPPPGDLPDPGIEPVSPLYVALAGGFFVTSATWEAPHPLSIYISVAADPPPTSFLLIPFPSSVPAGLLTVG